VAFLAKIEESGSVFVQVGKTGLSVGIDVRKAAVKLAVSNIKRLRSSSQEFSSQASACKIELQNVFMPSNKHQVQYETSLHNTNAGFCRHTFHNSEFQAQPMRSWHQRCMRQTLGSC